VRAAAPDAPPHAPLTREDLADVVDLTLTTGQFLLEHGATSMRVEETMDLVSNALGVAKVDVLVSPNVLIVTTEDGPDFRTKARRIGHLHVHMASLHSVMQLVASLDAGELTRQQYRERLEAIARTPPLYSGWVVALMVGLACTGFAAILRHTTDPSVDNPLASPATFLDLLSTFVGSTLAMRLRQWMLTLRVSLLANALVSAFAAFVIAGTVAHVVHAPHFEPCVPASVLFVVPGVSLLNAVDELLSGHLVIGLSRAVQTIMIFLAIGLAVLSANRVLTLAGLM
jgi:uncharacterized membrane protein YjjP (DUF1212 family)